MKTSSSLKITDSIRAIKNQVCEECGTQAKGFVYRKAHPIYYCHKCLRDKISSNGRLVA